MARRIVTIMVVLLLIVGGWWYYSTHIANRTNLGSGDVFSTDAAPSKTIDGASDLDGKPLGTVVPTPSRSDAPGTVNTEPVAGYITNQPPAAKTPFPSTPATLTPTSPSALPVSDSQAANNPNGLHFGGSGKYQWYRQGDLTWRINTQSGSTCIAFATMEEWNKPIVYSHGCGNV